MPSNTFFPKLTSINFTIKNLSANRKIHIFNYPINPGQTRDLLAIPEISEMDIRHSLIKGELANFIRNKTISIISSSIDLTQFDPQQLQFLTSASSLNPNVINPPLNPNANLSDGHSLITQNTTVGGDLIGQLSNLNINKLQGNLLQASSPSIGNILTYNGTAWTPQIAPSGTFLPGQDLTGSSTLQRVIGIDGYAITTKPLPGQGLVLQSNGTYQHQAFPFVVNIKQFGAIGNTIHDDTVAIQAAFTFFSGTNNFNGGAIYVPNPGPGKYYKITQPIVYVGGDSGSLKVYSDSPAVSAGIATAFYWAGATDGYMMTLYGANNLKFENLVWNGANTAQTCIWAHTNQAPIGPGGAPSFNVIFEDCSFTGCKGLHPSPGYLGTQGLVTIGDIGNQQEVAGYYFNRCFFSGVGADTGQTFACINILGGSNTEDFTFNACQFAYAQYGLYWNNAANNTLNFDDCGFGQISQACVSVLGSSTTRMTNCGAENNILTGDFIGQGYWYIGGQSDMLYVNGGEITMNTPNTIDGCVIRGSGHLEIRNCKIDCSGESGSNNIGGIFGGTGNFANLIIENCLWAGATEQIPVYDGNHNNITNVYHTVNGNNNNYGQRVSTQIHFKNNTGYSFSNDAAITLPNYTGRLSNNWSYGTVLGQGNLDPRITYGYVNQNRYATTSITIPYTTLNVAADGYNFNSGGTKFFTNPPTKIVSIVAAVNQVFSGGSIATMTFSCGDGVAGNTTNYLKAVSNNLATTTASAGIPIGGQASDLGTNLSSPVQGGYYGSWLTAGSNLQFVFTSTGDTLNHLTQGSLTIYITTEALF